MRAILISWEVLQPFCGVWGLWNIIVTFEHDINIIKYAEISGIHRKSVFVVLDI
jgi:hypothetical protein